MENIECVLIKINEDLEGDALYERTRKCWKGSLNNIKNKKIVFCIFNSKIKEVYEVFNWEECPRDKSMGVQFVGKVSTNFKELINLDVSSMYKRGNANPIMYKDLVDIVQLNNHGKIIIANITWSDNGWTEKFTDNSSNHRYVQKGGLAHECYNFNFESEWNDNYQYGFFQATNQPKLNGNKNIVFFHSQNKIVGVYVNVELGKFDKKIFDDDFDFNLKADKSLSFKFDTFLEMDKEDYLDGKQRIGQVGFNYVEKKSAKNILEDFIDLSSNDSLKEKAKEILSLIENVQFPTIENGEKNMSHSNITQQPLNQILYGPPGTGKTFNTINKALEIIFEKEDSENTEFYEFDFDSALKITYKDALLIEDEQYKRKVLKGIFEHYIGTQIEFVTFHQSYGYEEFIEGIKAIPVGKEGNETDEMIYDVIDGIFKKISDRAKNNIIKSSNKRITYKLNAPSINIQAEMVEIDKDNYKVLKNSKIRKDEAPSFKNYNYSKLRKEVLSNAKLKEESEYYILEDDYIFNSLSAASSVILGRMSNGLSDWKISETNDISNEKINGNYILIIDEINRGNISKIFGELITLIESTKRLGKEEQIKVRLPYSGEEFGVPSNLYIIGTMNTADRSIALMDTALRRRFHFEEMMPDLERLEQIENIDGINIKLLVESINKRIEYLYDRDHTIGHAYFMALKDKNNIETLSTIFQNKIIPLLQEYFYDDWKKIRLVLSDNQKEDENLQFIKIKQGYNLKDLFGDKGLDSLDIDDESNIYEINKAAFDNHKSYIKVYEK